MEKIQSEMVRRDEDIPESVRKVFKEYKKAEVEVYTMIMSLSRFMVGDEYEAYKWVKRNGYSRTHQTYNNV